jgi:hypothetical protein
MSAFDIKSTRAASAAVIAIAIAAVSGVAWAAVPDTSNVIHGCYGKVRGDLKVIEGDACPKGYLPLNWNQQGIQGVPGDQGIQGIPGVKGDQGIQGIQGPSGISDQEVVTVSVPQDTSEGKTGTATCPAGKSVLGGGYAMTASIDARASIVRASRPTAAGDGWTVNAFAFNSNWGLNVYAICA